LLIYFLLAPAGRCAALRHAASHHVTRRHAASRYASAFNRAGAPGLGDASKGYWLHANHLADRSDAEKAHMRGARWSQQAKQTYTARARAELAARGPRSLSAEAPPATVDWRAVPAFPGSTVPTALTNPPKDQGECTSRRPCAGQPAHTNCVTNRVTNPR
jgi:hypothetical protein